MDCFPLTLICFLSLSSLFLLSSPTARVAPVPVVQLTIPYLPYLRHLAMSSLSVIGFDLDLDGRLDSRSPAPQLLTLQLSPAALPPQRPDLHTFFS